MASLGTLVAGVAHELNTPIGVAVTAASTLQVRTHEFVKRYHEGGLKKSELEAYVQTAHTGADLTLRNLERAAHLIQSFKQVAVDQTSDQQRVINLRQYLEGVITSLEPKWKTTHHRVEIDCDETLELETYPGAIAQIITNFITNSLLHGFEGYTEEGVMRIAAKQDDGSITLSYSDNGRGVPPDVLPRIFDPFFTTKQAQGGTGLGMHIVFNLVTQKLGGEIRCESEVGKGTLFTIQLPL
jgi:signal transduction histidine kinase